jgi:hypothetical protein
MTDDILDKFNSVNLLNSINTAINQLSPNSKGAIIAYADNDDVHLAIITKDIEGFKLEGVIEKPYHGNFKFGLGILKEW